MYVIRCTRKLLDRGAPQHSLPSGAPTTVLGDWYANIVFERPEQLVVCISERTLLPVIVPAKDIKRLPDRIASAAEEILKAIGVPPEDVAAETLAMQEAYFAKTVDRRVIGSLNDFVFHVQHGTASRRDLSLHERAIRLARMPSAVLEYAYPSEAALAAFVASNALRAAKSAA
jgi:hypothetical protein